MSGPQSSQVASRSRREEQLTTRKGIFTALPHALGASPLERHLMEQATESSPQVLVAVVSAAVTADSAVPTSIPSGYYDPRSPAVRARSRNPWSPFVDAADKVARFKQWEVEFNGLLEKHRDAMPALRAWIGTAVDHLSINAAPMYAVNRTIAILDGRKDDSFIFVLKHAMHMLGSGWGLIIFHTAENEQWWVDQLEIKAGGGGQYVQLQCVEPITFAQANSLAASPAFYERIPINCETIIVMQPDTMMLRSDYLPGASYAGPSFSHLIDTYAYLGAPWSWCTDPWCRVGGNGGLSLRKRSVMLDLLQEVRCNDWSCKRVDMFHEYYTQQEFPMKHVEDSLLAYQLYDHAYKYTAGVSQLATPEIAAWFSMESLDFPAADPFFAHKIWAYLPSVRYGPLMAHVKQYYPELWLDKEGMDRLAAEVKESG